MQAPSILRFIGKLDRFRYIFYREIRLMRFSSEKIVQQKVFNDSIVYCAVVSCFKTTPPREKLFRQKMLEISPKNDDSLEKKFIINNVNSYEQKLIVSAA